MGRRTLPTAIVLGVMFCSTAAAQEHRNPSDNAALWYWRAIDQLPFRQADDDNVNRALRAFWENPTGELSETLRGTIGNFGEGIAQLRKGSLKTHCDFGIDRDEGFYAVLSHLGGLRRCAMLLCVEARQALDTGNSTVAADRLAVCYRMAVHIGSDRTLASSLLAYEVFDHADRFVKRALEAGSFSESDKRALRKALALIDPHDPLGLASCIEGEREMGSQWMFRRYRGDGGLRRFLRDFSSVLPGGELGPFTGVNQSQFAQALRGYDRALKELVALFKQPDTADAQARISEIMDEIDQLRYGPVAKLFVPKFMGKTYSSLLKIRTRLGG